ncbi:MAG: hypothetical protein FWF82_06635, partial [Oscillospiraceae bacterium]|nr:hypothetical protein [Oscillospiraceae bacterium]
MSNSRVMSTVVDISGTLSPSLQKAVDDAVGRLENMSAEMLDSAGSAAKLAVEIDSQEETLKALQKQYANYVVSGEDGTVQAEKLAGTIQSLSKELTDNKNTLETAQNAAKKLADGMGNTETASDKLHGTVSKQESELEALKKRYSDLTLEQGGNSKEAKSLAKQIDKLSGDLKSNKKKVEDSEKAADSFDKTLDEVGDTLTKTGKSAEKSGDGFKNLENVVAGVSIAVGAAMAAIGAAAFAAGGKICDMAVEAAAAGDRVDKASQRLGFSAQSYQEWDYVISQCGGNIDSLGVGMKTLQKTMDGLTEDGGKASDAFKKVG